MSRVLLCHGRPAEEQALRAGNLDLLLCGDEESESWRMPADLRPLYYAPLPVEERELHGTIENALAPGLKP